MNSEKYMFYAILRYQEYCVDYCRNQGVSTRCFTEEYHTVVLRCAVSREYVVADGHTVLKVNMVWTVEIPKFVFEITFTLIHRNSNGLIKWL